MESNNSSNTSPYGKNDVTGKFKSLFWAFLILLTIILTVLKEFDMAGLGHVKWRYILSPIIMPFALTGLFVVWIIVKSIWDEIFKKDNKNERKE